MSKKSTRSSKIDCDPMLTVSGLCRDDEQPEHISSSSRRQNTQPDRHVDFDDMGSPTTIAAK